MSTVSLTYWATFVAGVSILLLVLLDRRKPARRERVGPRRLGRGGIETAVVQLPAAQYVRTPWWRRLLALTGLGVATGLMGMIVAVVVGAIVVGFFWYLSNVVS